MQNFSAAYTRCSTLVWPVMLQNSLQRHSKYSSIPLTAIDRLIYWGICCILRKIRAQVNNAKKALCSPLQRSYKGVLYWLLIRIFHVHVCGCIHTYLCICFSSRSAEVATWKYIKLRDNFFSHFQSHWSSSRWNTGNYENSPKFCMLISRLTDLSPLLLIVKRTVRSQLENSKSPATSTSTIFCLRWI